jgi:hypothetical protein
MMDLVDGRVKWVRLLAYVTGLVNQELLRNERLAAENQILKAHLEPGCRLSDGKRRTPSLPLGFCDGYE